MEFKIAQDQLDTIEAGIRQKYSKVADSPEGQFAYPTGRKGLEALHYDRTLIDKLPDAVASCYCGVGNPFSLGKIGAGERILDVGCGAGVDTILAAMMAAPNGSAVGVDIVPEMLARAESNRKMTGLGNVSFQNAAGNHLPFSDDAFDVVISNGVINLIPDKEGALAEIHRVLTPGGRLMVADQVAVESVEKDIQTRLANWFH
jgi:arsenite methyltransferase